MIAFNDFQTAFLDYAARNRLWEFLQAGHSHEDLNELMLLILEGEEQILQSFGLPCTLGNSSLLQIASLNENFGLADIRQLYRQLGEEAGRYLGGKVQTDLQLLEIAQKWGLYIDEVLPQTSMKLKAEAYYHFLYAQYFLPGSISPECFLKEIRIVAKNDLATRLYRLSGDPAWQTGEEYGKLAGFGLSYLQEFMEGYGGLRKEQDLNAAFAEP